jgi:hypothetical protein
MEIGQVSGRSGHADSCRAACYQPSCPQARAGKALFVCARIPERESVCRYRPDAGATQHCAKLHKTSDARDTVPAAREVAGRI